MTIQEATNQEQWDSFLAAQTFSPFLQSWTMGDVYEEAGQKPIRLEVRDRDELKGICQAIIVSARRGKHLAVSYGPVLAENCQMSAISLFTEELKKIAKEHNCTFIRMSPFWTSGSKEADTLKGKSSPLHLLAEHIWYLPLQKNHPWKPSTGEEGQRTEEKILKEMRKNTRNLIHRAEREGVEIIRSDDPIRDLPHFIKLHEETRKRHHFTPYTDSFFRAQVARFASRNECTLYLARYQGEVIASSIHMHLGGETSYHHGASTHKYSKIPASYLLQWTAIQDAIKRGDHTYSFWGIAPPYAKASGGKPEYVKKHPFAGVTLFKRGFGGELLELTHCMDIPISKKYYLTRAFETARKWRRGF